MTFELADGERAGMSFLVPRTQADLARRRAMMEAWARVSLGTLGRTGDYLNSALVALGAAGPWFAQADPAFARNIHAYYERVRDEDLLLTHTLITPQANRSQNAAQQEGGDLTARIVREDDSGVVIRGARMLATIGPIADEMLVFPSTVLKGDPQDAPYCFALALPCDAPGVRFVCRESFDVGRDAYDHPLSSRFEEIDAVVIFDDVHVPFERCFLLGHPEMCNAIYTDTTAAAHMTHQVATRAAVKTEATLGLVSLLARDDRDRPVRARAGGHRRGDRRARDRARADRRVRARCRAQPLRRDDASDGAAQRVPQLVPESVAALPPDPSQARRERPGGPADPRRPRRRRGRGNRALPAFRDARRSRPRAALPPRVGHEHVGVRRPPGALRVFLLRRPGARWRGRSSAATTAPVRSSWSTASWATDRARRAPLRSRARPRRRQPRSARSRRRPSAPSGPPGSTRRGSARARRARARPPRSRRRRAHRSSAPSRGGGSAPASPRAPGSPAAAIKRSRSAGSSQAATTLPDAPRCIGARR